jgi:hypothetical protein
MTEAHIAELHDRVSAMTEEQRLALDPIAYALAAYQEATNVEHWRVVPNRVAALAAVDAMNAWEKTIWERE